jgi:hypothetical protein
VRTPFPDLVPQGRLNLAQDASPGLDLKGRPSPVGTAENRPRRIRDNFQPSLPGSIMLHDAPGTSILGEVQPTLSNQNHNLHRDKTTKIRIYCSLPTRTSLLQTALGLCSDLSRFSRTFVRHGHSPVRGREIMKFDHLDKTKDLARSNRRHCVQAEPLSGIES